MRSFAKCSFSVAVNADDPRRYRALVALIHQDDNEHRICKETFLTFNEPLGTVWPVLTEALYLLNFSWEAQNALWDMVQAGAVEILPLGTDDVSSPEPNKTEDQVLVKERAARYGRG